MQYSLNFYGVKLTIKKHTAIASCDNGGLHIIDIESKHQALKFSWIPKLLNENSALANVLNTYLVAIGINKNLLLKLCTSKK